MCVKNLPQANGRELNSRPLESQANALPDKSWPSPKVPKTRPDLAPFGQACYYEANGRNSSFGLNGQVVFIGAVKFNHATQGGLFLYSRSFLPGSLTAA